MTDNAQRRVLVLNGNGNNLGDQAIFAGWLRVFGDAVDAAGLDVIVDQSFIYDLPFREETIATINQSYDLLVMGGGGFLYHRGADKSASGWGFDIPEELIPSLEVPFAIYSTGYNYRAFAPEHFPAHTASHVRATVKHAAHFSVREHGSVKKLEEAFGVSEGVSFVPDCALHVEPARVHLPRLDPSRKSLGLCLRIDRPEERFPAPFSQSFERYIQTLVETCKQLVEEDGYQIVFTPHLLTAGDLEVGVGRAAGDVGPVDRRRRRLLGGCAPRSPRILSCCSTRRCRPSTRARTCSTPACSPASTRSSTSCSVNAFTR